ncbi:triphosphoribosyl-dephospho-CoA synthase, partial [Lactobacillus acetotolerans]
VKDIALPFLKNSTGDIQTRLLDTLMKIATIASDSNLIKRAGNINVIPWLRQHAKQYLQLGGYGTTQGKEYLLNLNKEMTKRNYSLGGCADLLIVTIFIGLERGYL